MDLLMKNIHMCRQSKQAKSQVILEEDLNVPDVCPDVDTIIQSRERIIQENTRTENGKVFVEGTAEICILYMDDTPKHRLHRLETRFPFAESFAVEGISAGDTVRVRYETEDLNVSMINSRKLAIRVLITFLLSRNETYDLAAAVETQTSLRTCERRKKLELMQLEVQNKDIIRMKEEVTIPSGKPNIQEILWENVQLRSCRTKPEEGRLQVSGKLYLFVLYRTQEEGEAVHWTENTIPFEGEVRCTGCSARLVPDVEMNLSQIDVQVKEDADGEARVLHLEGILDLEMRLYGSEEAEILEDIYSPDKELELVTSEDSYETLVMRNESRCRASGRIRIQAARPRILQICHCSGSIKIDKAQITPHGVQLEGAIPVSILYISSDDTMPFSVLEGTIPFSHLAEIQGLDEHCRFTLTTCLEQLSASMADSEEIEVKATAGLDVFAVRGCTQTCIHEIHEKEYAREKLDAIPGITGYLVQGEESLWEIAREHCMTVEEIMEMNAMENDQIHPGDCLILMKSVRN